MTLGREYERSYQRNEPESLQNFVIKIVRSKLNQCIQKKTPLYSRRTCEENLFHIVVNVNID